MSKVSTDPRVLVLPGEYFQVPVMGRPILAKKKESYPEKDGGETIEFSSSQPTLLNEKTSGIAISDTKGFLALLDSCLNKWLKKWLFLDQKVLKMLQNSPLLRYYEENKYGILCKFAGNCIVVLQKVQSLPDLVIVREGSVRGKYIFFPKKTLTVFKITVK